MPIKKECFGTPFLFDHSGLKIDFYTLLKLIGI